MVVRNLPKVETGVRFSYPAPCMIVIRKAGYYVLSKKTRRNLGGPYKTRKEAVRRLRQVEFFKRKSK